MVNSLSFQLNPSNPQYFLNVIMHTNQNGKGFWNKGKTKDCLGCNKQKQTQLKEILEVLYVMSDSLNLMARGI